MSFREGCLVIGGTASTFIRAENVFMWRRCIGQGYWETRIPFGLFQFSIVEDVLY